MKIIKDTSNTVFLKRSVVSVGNFDGIHRGHQQLIDKLRQRSAFHKAPSVILTFIPHTRILLSPDYQLSLLTTFEEKVELIQRIVPVDYIFGIPFTKDIANW